MTVSRSSQELTLHWDLTIALDDSFITMTWNQIYSQNLPRVSLPPCSRLLAAASLVAPAGLHKEVLAALCGSIYFSYLVLWRSHCWGANLPRACNWSHAAHTGEQPTGSAGARYLPKGESTSSLRPPAVCTLHKHMIPPTTSKRSGAPVQKYTLHCLLGTDAWCHVPRTGN